MKKITNAQKILKALKSGPKTQADLLRETQVKNVYQVVSNLIKSGKLIKDSGGHILIAKPPLSIAVDKTDKVTLEQIKAVTERLKSKITPRATLLQDEIDNINDGIRALMVTRSYLIRRIEEEKRDA